LPWPDLVCVSRREEYTPSLAMILDTLAVQIGSMKRKHVEACASIMGRLGVFKKYKYTSAAARAMLECALKDRRSKLVIATHHRTVVGFVWFVPRGAFDRSGYLRLLAVDAPFHGQGIGRRLMNFLEKRHLHSGGIVLLASSFNDDAQGFYERLGYRLVGELPNYVYKGLNERIYFKPPPG